MKEIKCDICGGDCKSSGRYTFNTNKLKYFSIFRNNTEDVCFDCINLLKELADDGEVKYKFKPEHLEVALKEYFDEDHDFEYICDRFCLTNKEDIFNKIELSVMLRLMLFDDIGVYDGITNDIALEIIRNAWFISMGKKSKIKS